MGEAQPRKRLQEGVRDLYPPKERFYIATMQTFQAAMQWVKVGGSLTTWKFMMRHLNAAGVGGLLYHTYEGISSIVLHVSNQLHEKLVIEVNKNNPITLMIDTYQVHNNNFVSII